MSVRARLRRWRSIARGERVGYGAVGLCGLGQSSSGFSRVCVSKGGELAGLAERRFQFSFSKQEEFLMRI